jgi:hypothetical protein
LMAGFTIWTAASVAWTTDTTIGVQNTQRNLAYLGVVLAGCVLAGCRPSALRVSVILSCVLLCVYGTVVHLFPDAFGLYSQVAAESAGRLSYPLGYWNTEGLLAAFTIILVTDHIAVSASLLFRAAMASTVPFVAVNLLFTVSRGAAIALAVGTIAWLTLDPDRLRKSVWLLIVASISAAAVADGNSVHSLFGHAYSLGSASGGHRLFIHLCLFSVLSAAATVVFARLERGLSVPRWASRVYVGLCIVAALVFLGTAVDRYGAPTAWPRSVYNALVARPPRGNPHLSRLLNFSLNNRNYLWTVARDEVAANPLIGNGAGSFGVAWYRHRQVAVDTRSAHNLYLETIAETGVIGGVLLGGFLLLPIVSAVRSRHEAFIAGLAGAYVAFLVHAGVDWDWWIPGMTMPALWCAVVLLTSDRRSRAVRLVSATRASLAVLALVIAAVAVVTLIGDEALSRSYDAANSGHYARAVADARFAAKWQPWSYLPWIEIGTADLAQKHRKAAAGAFVRATEAGPNTWQSWVALAAATSGRRRAAALSHAYELNPLGTQVAALCPPHFSTPCS